MTPPRRMVLITDGCTDAHTAKTAICLVRYRPEEVVAVLDRQSAGKTCQQTFGVGGQIPCVGTLAEAPEANTLVVGIAPPGGKIPPHWRPMILEAIRRKMTVVSGLHDLLRDDPEFRRAAAEHDVQLVDVRDNQEHDVASRLGIREHCLRIHTVANDCSCGKMVTSVEVARGLSRAGVDAAFVATGQTGILVAGSGCPIDRVIADFVAGAAEKLVLANQHHEVMLVEGQGSLFHPRYSCVTLGLLHGLMPDGLILCYEMGRRAIFGMENVPLAPLERVLEFYEAAANIMHPCRVIGVAVNGQKFPDDAVAAECDQVSRRLGLPACDVIRHGPDRLVEAVIQLRRQLGK
jgi:uncharacterized NAD-dependent epimerase/dehydratase family protein